MAQSSDKKIIVIITSPVTLFEVAQILKNYPHILGVNSIETALNLDGGASTGMYVEFQNDPFYFPEIKPVKTFLLFD